MGQLLEDDRGDAAVAEHVGAEIAPQDAAGERQELCVERLIEAHLGEIGLAHRLGRARPERDRDRVARHEMDHAEQHRHRADHDHQREPEPPQRIEHHAANASRSDARTAAGFPSVGADSDQVRSRLTFRQPLVASVP